MSAVHQEVTSLGPLNGAGYEGPRFAGVLRSER